MLASVVVDRPGLWAVVGYVINQNETDERFILANINFLMQLAGNLADTFKKSDAERFDVGRAIAIVGAAGSIQRSGGDALEFAIEPNGLIARFGLNPFDRAEQNARAKSGERHDDGLMRAALAVRIGRRHDNSILGGANNDAPFSQIYGNFLSRI